MAAITDLSALINRMTGGNSGTPETVWWFKVARMSGSTPVGVPIAGRPYSIWMYEGSPSAGVAPTTWANPDNTTAGGLLQTDPGGARTKWLIQAFAAGLTPGTLLLVDRLGHNGNLSGTVTTAQTFTGTITRYTSAADAVGNIMWYEIWGNTTTILGATGTTITVSYTNQAGTASRTSTAVAIGGTGFREGNQIRFLPLQSGDTGVLSVQSATLAASTGTAGAFGIVIAKPLAYMGLDQAGAPGWREFATGLPGLPEIKTDACLSFVWIPQTTTNPELFGGVSMVEA